jgi:sugar lactone lactonase YvrE
MIMARSFFISVALIACFSAVSAVVPAIWEVHSSEDINKGDVENLSVGEDGVLSLAPEVEDLGETGERLIWDLAEDANGTIYVATGTNGRLYRKSGDKDAELVFDSPQSQLQSLVFDDRGNLFAGSAPSGIIYRIRPDGTAAEFYHTGETYVWDLEFSKGNLLAATGTQGRVLVIDATGDQGKLKSIALNSPDRHVVSLISDGKDGYFAGTEGTGLVYHINSDYKSRLLFQSKQKEIHCMAMGPDDKLYVAATASKPKTTASKAKPETPGGVIYRLEPSGAATYLWRAPYPLILDIAPFDETRLLVSTGPRGVLYLVNIDGHVERIADTGESQPSILLKTKSGDILIGMSNSGKIKRLTRKLAMSGTFTSDVHNAFLVSQWGRVETRARIPSDARVVIETRTGNSKKPGRHWSRWAAMTGPRSESIQSPPGRYAQVRATISRDEDGKPPRVFGFRVTGQQVNIEPRILKLTVKPYRESRKSSSSSSSKSGQGEDKEKSEKSSARPSVYKRTIMMIRWAAADANRDDLSYSVYYRSAGDGEWLLLKENHKKRLLYWDIEGAPEGTTELKLVASDRPSNPWSTALSAERVSDPFDIDYTGPVVGDLRARVRPDGAVRLTGVANDVSGSLHKGAYSIDSGEWLAFFPKDGIFDSSEETLDLVTEKLEDGPHTIVVKVYDVAGNVGSKSAVVNVRKR